MNDKHDTDVDKVIQKTVNALDESIEHLDAPTLSRLNQARHQALAATEKPRLFNSQWIKAGAFAILLVTVINGLLFLSTPKTQHMHTDDFELVVVNDDFELLQNLDFVAWMIEEEHAS